MITFQDIKNNKEIATMVNFANKCLAEIGYTDHGPRHVGFVSKTAASILSSLNHDERSVELAAIAGWVHDVGNLINRKGHGAAGAIMLFQKLLSMGMPIEEVCIISSAVGSHEEQSGKPVNAVSAALIIADKIDAHKTRVRRGKFDLNDIHDRVNYSIHKTNLIVDNENKHICFEFTMNETSSVMEYMQIYLSRMNLCELASEYLGCTFSLIVNKMLINRNPLPNGNGVADEKIK